MRWLFASTAMADARLLKGLSSVPVPLVAAAGLTNQVTGPEMAKVALTAVLQRAGSGLPLSQTVNGKTTVPVTPAAGSKVNAPVSTLATTVPTLGMTAVMAPATCVVTPLTLPTEKSAV